MYIPKNKIKTNQYTRGQEYVYLSNKEDYVGYYHKLYNGKFFTGKTPNDKPVYELIIAPTNDEQWDSTPITGEGTYTSYASNFDGGGEYGETLSPNAMRDLDIYNSLQKVNMTKILKNPTPFYPSPAKSDYDLGVFTRYFCVKVNENIYYEINKQDYDSLSDEDRTFDFKLYTPFQILWTISGDEKEVERTNYNMVLIKEKRIKRRGLKEFLRGNYTKFYKSNLDN